MPEEIRSNEQDVRLEDRVREAYRALTTALIERDLSITAMESMTGGLISSLITDTEGASAVFRGSFVTYSNEAKIGMGVPEETIREHSVYSVETAEAMANDCRLLLGASIGIGVTGSAGNVDPENSAASVPGEVFFAVSTEDGTDCFSLTLDPAQDRHSMKLIVADEVAGVIRELLSNGRFGAE